MLTTLSTEDLIPADYPIRKIRVVVDAVLGELDPIFESMYAMNRPGFRWRLWPAHDCLRTGQVAQPNPMGANERRAQQEPAFMEPRFGTDDSSQDGCRGRAVPIACTTKLANSGSWVNTSATLRWSSRLRSTRRPRSCSVVGVRVVTGLRLRGT